jgi:hypothetical protein
MIYCGKAEFGQIFRSFSLNSGAIRLKRPKNLTQIGFPSLRSVKPDRLLGSRLYNISGESTEIGPHYFNSVVVWIIADLEIK